MEFIQGLFSSQPSLDRLNPTGIVLMVLGAALALFIGPNMEKKNEAMRGKALLMRMGGLLLACAGAMISMFK